MGLWYLCGIASRAIPTGIMALDVEHAQGEGSGTSLEARKEWTLDLREDTKTFEEFRWLVLSLPNGQ